MTDRPLINIAPEMTMEKYAELIGVTERTVRGWVGRGLLPTLKVGKRRMINVSARTLQCIEQMQGAM